MSDVDHELSCAESGLLIVPRALATLRVTGKDRQSWLNGLVTQDLVPRKTGDAALALVVAKNGKIEAEVAILFGADEILMGLPTDLASGVRDKLDHHLIMEDAAIEVATEPLEWIFGFGPLAEEALSVARAKGAIGGVTLRSDLPLVVIAAPSIGPVIEAVKSIADGRVAVATDAGWLRFRIERGIAERGSDFSEGESYAQEAALEKDEVSFAKGCYLGQEAVFMLEKRGHVSKRLVQIIAPSLLAVGAEIRDAEGKSIGKVTSAAPKGAGAVALGIVKYKHARTAHEIHIDHGSEPSAILAEITSLLVIPNEE